MGRSSVQEQAAGLWPIRRVLAVASAAAVVGLALVMAYRRRRVAESSSALLLPIQCPAGLGSAPGG